MTELGNGTPEWDGNTVLPVAVMVGHLDDGHGNRRWQALGVVVGQQFAADEVGARRMRSGPDGDLFLWTGFRFRLHRDHTEDYAYNLQGERPGIYVVVSRAAHDADFRLLAVTLSLDEAQNLDATDLRSPDEEVLTVPMPPEVYRWVERFVLEHHVPRKRGKRGKKRSRAMFDAEVGDWAGDGQ